MQQAGGQWQTRADGAALRPRSALGRRPREVVSAGAPPRAFPWAALDSTTRAETSVVRDVRRWMAAHTDPERLAVVLSELLGVRLEIRVRRVRPVDQPQGLEGGAAIALASVDSPGLERAVLIEAEPALVAAVVAHVLRRRSPLVHQGGVPASGGLFGAFAAIVAATVRRAHGGVVPRVIAAGPAPALEIDLARTAQELASIGLTVLVGDEAFVARVVAPRSALLGLPLVPWDAIALAALGTTPLTLLVVGHTVTLPAADVARLCEGDALMLPAWPLTRVAPSPHVGGVPTVGLSGRVVLAAPASLVGIEASLGEDGRLVLAGVPVPLCGADAEETERADGMDRSALIEAIGDVPVLVRVEIGEAQMTAREWASLGRGDVVALGRRIGESVVLRVGGVPVARGELVEIDGEVGVRLVERLGTAGAPK